MMTTETTMPTNHTADWPFKKTLTLANLENYHLYESSEAASQQGAQTVTPLGWQLSPFPYVLTPKQHQFLETLGHALWQFTKALDLLYKESTKGRQPEWIAQLLNQGKPEDLLKFAQMNRVKNLLPMVIRPDLLVTEDGLALTEIDSVPGGIGFTSALNHLYKASNFDVLAPTDTDMPGLFLKALQTEKPDLKNPCIAVVLSDEAADYKLELSWLVNHLQARNANIHLIHPDQLSIDDERLVFTESNQTTPIDIVYRFFELFDLPNIPTVAHIQEAIKRKWVACTPPLKPHLEEKLALALLHHPILKPFWEQQLKEHFETLVQVVPPTWIVDPTPLPPQATIPNLTPGGKAIQSFTQLGELSQKERQLVLKPSGFSPLAWGSRGVTVGHDHSTKDWQESLNTAINSFGSTPYILQTFENTQLETLYQFDAEQQTPTPYQGRTRLCPYYFIQDDEPRLAGVLATSCPANKKIIHGMRDATLAPCSVLDNT